MSSRICHDLINPIGAISNGLELLETIGQSFGPELTLVADSAARARAKLNFFRIAFGDAAEGQEVKAALLERSMLDMYEGTRFKTRLDDGGYVNISRPDAKLVALLVLCMESTLPLGGDVSLTCRTAKHWIISAEAPKTNWNEDAWGVITGSPSEHDTTSYNVQFLAARYAALQNQCVVTATHSEGTIGIALRAVAR